MTIYLSDRTGASIDTVLDNASASGIGKLSAQSTTDWDNTLSCGFFRGNPGVTGAPEPTLAFTGATFSFDGNTSAQILSQAGVGGKFFVRSKSTTWNSWNELYHTGNTGNVVFGESRPAGGESDKINFTPSNGNGNEVTVNTTTTGLRNNFVFYNPNGVVGSISTSGTATAYNTSSDPRLKDFSAAPSDTDIDSKFNDLFGAFRTFNWKSDPTGDLVWGFDAHATIDAGLDVGSEGEGPRELALGDVYNTTPAVFEDQEVPLLYKSGERLGQPRFDSEGVALTETVSVEVTAAIEHKVSPAGVDQSKAVPILLAKIEQLERRLVAAGL
tara:strand:+ start:1093 stop:2076 length:984 start_codon:yes stop_codon:yes gene_type:complete